MTGLDISAIFAEVAAEMRANLGRARAALRHAHSKGVSVEQIFRDFWSEYLPQNVGIAEGFVIGVGAAPSKQQDVIFFQADRTPILYRSGNLRVLPVEATAAASEVKTTIDSYDDVVDCLEKAVSYKAIQRKAYHSRNPRDAIVNTRSMFGEDRENWSSIFFVTALSGAPIGRISEWVQRAHQERRVEFDMGIDSLLVLDSGVITNVTAQGFDLLPTKASAKISLSGEDNLLMFYLLASRYLCQIDVGNVAIQKYATLVRVAPVPPSVSG